MKKIKVLQLPIANARGGITQYALQNWKFIDKSIFQFDFATRSKTLDFADELIQDGCKIHYLSCSSEEDERQFIKEINRILDESYDVVHLHTSYWKGFLVEKLALERNCPNIIVHSHSTMIDLEDEQERTQSIAKHNYYRKALPINYATNFCACSKLAAEWLFGDQIPKHRIKVLRNAIDVEKYSFNSYTRKEYREKLGLTDNFVMGHIGRFTYQKNHKMLLEIFREVYKRLPIAKLLLIGGGPLEEDIRQAVIDYGIEDAVIFLGKRSDVPQLLQAMDVFLLPSFFEGLPIVLVEGQAAGLKCFVSDRVSLEAKITSNISYLQSSISDWVVEIMKVAGGYNREKTDHLLADSGYDLSKQIKLIEKLYAGEDISQLCPSAVDAN